MYSSILALVFLLRIVKRSQSFAPKLRNCLKFCELKRYDPQRVKSSKSIISLKKQEYYLFIYIWEWSQNLGSTNKPAMNKLLADAGNST